MDRRRGLVCLMVLVFSTAMGCARLGFEIFEATGADDAGLFNVDVSDVDLSDAEDLGARAVSSDAGIRDGSAPALGNCSTDGWCWASSASERNALFGVWGSASSDVWFVGGSGAIHHFDGSKLELVESNTSAALDGVWGSAPNDIWAVGADGTIVHYDGVRWQTTASGTFSSLWSVYAANPTAAWAVGRAGTLLRFDGSQWSPVPVPTSVLNLIHVHGSGADDVWAVGNSSSQAGIALHWNGSAWSERAMPPSPNLFGVYAFAPNQAVAVGFRTALIFDGVAWAPIPNVPPEQLTSVWASGARDIWTTNDLGDVWHYDGATWSKRPASSHWLEALWAGGPNDIWAAGANGTITRWDGTTWSPIRGAGAYNLEDVWRSPSGVLWAVGGDARGDRIGRIFSNVGSGWAEVTVPRASYLQRISGTADDDIWAVGARGTILHWDGNVWATEISNTTEDLFGVWASTRQDAWAAGTRGTLLRYDGSHWSLEASGTTEDLGAIMGSGSTDVWAVGVDSAIHFNGTIWSSFAIPRQAFSVLTDLYVVSPVQVWILGNYDAYEWNGIGWTRFEVNSSHPLRTIWSDRANGVFVAGVLGLIFHFDGIAWSPEVSGASNLLLGGVSSSADSWVVGEGGTILYHGPR